MRATKVLLASGIAVFAIFFFAAFENLDEGVDIGGRAALGAFEFFGAAVSLYLLSRGRPGNASLFDWLGCASAILVACTGFAGASLTLFALYLFLRVRPETSRRIA
jgi:hypothetical protein